MADSDGTSGSKPDGLQPEAATDDGEARTQRDASSDVSSTAPVDDAVVEPEDTPPAVQVIVPANATSSSPGKRPKAARKRQQPLAATTLQSGAALQNTWKAWSALPASGPAQDATAVAAADPGGARSDGDASGVHSLGSDEAPVLTSDATPASERPSDDDTPLPVGHAPLSENVALTDTPRITTALADTQQDDARQRTLQQRAARSGRLARTLRMELKLGAGAPEAPPQAEPDTHAHGGRGSFFIGGAQRIGGSDSSEFSSGRPPLHNTDPLGAPNTRQPRGLLSDPRLQSSFTISAREASSVPPPLPRRQSRPGERTMILSRRAHVATKDWMFVGLLVAALGVTASMLWSYRNQPGSEPTAGEEASGDEPGATTNTVEHAITSDDNPTTDDAPAAQTASAIRATELRSEPGGAEVVAAGAVVGNTPVRVARGEGDTEYTLRLPGYEAQLVRVGANSPATIHVTLQPKAAPTPARAIAPREPIEGPAASQQPLQSGGAASPYEPARAIAPGTGPVTTQVPAP